MSEPKNRVEAKNLGLKYYYTGIPCKRGHLSKRKTCDWQCVQCQKDKFDPEYHKRYRERIKDRHKEWLVEYNIKNKEKIKENKRNVYIKKRDEILKSRKLFYKTNGDKIKNRLYSYRKNNKEITKEIEKRHYTKNREKIIARSSYQRSKRKNIEGKYTDQDIKRMLIAQEFKCVYCQKNIKEKFHVDHIMPIRRGGTNWPDNIQLLCPHCNQIKSDIHPDDFVKKIKLLLQQPQQ